MAKKPWYYWTFSRVKLFPLNRADRLGGEIHYDTVDTFDLMGDAVGDMVQEGIGYLLDGGGHGVGGV